MNFPPSLKPQDINPSQWEAVTYTNGHLLICAGPGTGKTHTLTRRIALCINQLKTGQKILAVTFTNKAAVEIEERLFKKLNCPAGKTTVGTFHSVCFRILKEFYALAGLKEDFKLASQDEILKAMDELKPDFKKRQKQEFLNKVSRIKSGLEGNLSKVEYQAYADLLSSKGWLDYDDVIIRTVDLLQNSQAVVEKLRKRYAFIFVDEYQDINGMQHELLRLLVQDGGVLTAIGDPHQAIYGFRGSDVKFFETFRQDFNGARVLSLKENYRSASFILDASSQVIAHSSSIHVPQPVAQIYEQGRLIVHEAASEKQEASYIAHQIERLVGGMSLLSKDLGRVTGQENVQFSFGDMAIFYRLNSQRFAIEKALAKQGIPYHVSISRQLSKSEENGEDICPSRDVEVSFDVEKVSLMTFHASKGLEFGVVFLTGCEEQFLPLNLNGLTSPKDEERRLFYVGMTRAKSVLYFTRAARRAYFGKILETKPSPFLLNIEEGLKEYEQNLLKSNRRQKREKQMSLFS